MNIQSRIDCLHRGVNFNPNVTLEVKTSVKSTVNLSSVALSYLVFFGTNPKIFSSNKNMQIWGIRNKDIVGISIHPYRNSLIHESGTSSSILHESFSPYKFDSLSNLDAEEDISLWEKVNSTTFYISYSDDLSMSSIQFPTMIIPWKKLKLN